ncbi:MAG TPA: beta-ketoacyl synthase N-terminal-like domain-containing protein, partial [Agitococcus sp.]|nr:beta-ketoacyl synthase N-terminal-like domain-containing protein [Agitococcus sp.]
MSRRRVVVTGLGMVTSLGADVASTWSHILQGKSGISHIDHFDASQYKTRFAGLVRDFKAEEYLPAKELRRYDEFMHYGIAAGVQAIQDAQLTVTPENASRIGVALGSGIGGLTTIEANHQQLLQKSKISPFFVP